MRTETKLKFKLQDRFDNLSHHSFKIAKNDLPLLTGYNWKTIYYQWAKIPMDSKRSIPCEPLDKLAKWFGCTSDDLKNYEIY